MTILLLSIWFTSAAWFGLAVADRALCGERRLAVLACYGILAGHVVQSVLLILIWGFLPLGTGFWIVVALSSLAGASLRIRTRRSQPHSWSSLGIARADAIATLILIGVFAVVTQGVFAVGLYNWDAEILFFHSAVTERMTFEQYPPTNPLEPDDPLRYRFGYHTLAAAIRSQSNELAPQVLLSLTTILMCLMLIALVGVSIRTYGCVRPGLVAAILGFFGGSLSLEHHLIQVAFFGSPLSLPLNPHLIFGLLWHGNTLDMVRVSPTVAIGFMAFLAGLWLSSEAVEAQCSSYARAVGAAALTYLGLVNEVFFVLLAVGLIVTSVVALLRPDRTRDSSVRRRQIVDSVLLVMISYAVVSFRGGLSGGVSLFGTGANSLNMSLNMDHLGYVPRPPYWPGEEWIPLLSSESLFDTVFVLGGLPLLLAVSLRCRAALNQRALFAGIAGLILWITTYSYTRPADSYRLGQAAISIYLCMLPVTLFLVKESLMNRLGRVSQVGSLSALVLIAPHLAVAALLMLARPEPILLRPVGSDAQAAAYLRSRATTDRILVPIADDGEAAHEGHIQVIALYQIEGPGAAARQLLAFSGRAIPLGHTPYFNRDAYLSRYRRAGRLFETGDLHALRIGWVYVLPSYLDEEQRQNLHEARARGDLAMERTFGESGTEDERLLLRFVHRQN